MSAVEKMIKKTDIREAFNYERYLSGKNFAAPACGLPLNLGKGVISDETVGLYPQQDRIF